MKKILLISLITMAFSTTGFSQEKYTRFSIVVNPQLSWIKSDNKSVADGSSSFGYNFGVVMDNFFTENYAFTTGLTINTSGGKLTYKATATDPINFKAGNETSILDKTTKIGYELRYIEVPLALKLRSSEFRRSHIYGQFGLSPQINIKATDDDNQNISDEVSLFELGYHFGGGLEYSVGGSNYFVVGLMYHNGFTDITTNESIEDKAILNRLSFQFGFIF